jgi:hypothetical protein
MTEAIALSNGSKEQYIFLSAASDDANRSSFQICFLINLGNRQRKKH